MEIFIFTSVLHKAMICQIANILRSNLMKTKILTRGKDDDFYSEISRKDRQYLKHILSPLELAALRHSYKPFNY